MSNEKKIEVLSSLLVILKLTNLYNKNGVSFKFNRISDSVKIPNFCLFCLISLPTLYLSSLFVWIIFEEKFDLKLISTSVAVLIGTSQITIAYISLAMKTDLVVSTVDHLQEVVGKSWFF